MNICSTASPEARGGYMMKKIFSSIAWMVMGIVLSLCVFAALKIGRTEPPKLLVDEEAIRETARDLMDHVCSGDYAEVRLLLSGSPDLGQPPQSDTPAGLLWQAYLNSIGYACADHCSCTDSQVTIDISLSVLDISAVTDTLQQTGQALLEERASQIHDESLVYDADHNYLESFLSQILMDATAQALDENSHTIERQLTLLFTRQDGVWKIVPTQELQQFLSGYVCQ